MVSTTMFTHTPASFDVSPTVHYTFRRSQKHLFGLLDIIGFRGTVDKIVSSLGWTDIRRPHDNHVTAGVSPFISVLVGVGRVPGEKVRTQVRRRRFYHVMRTTICKLAFSATVAY